MEPEGDSRFTGTSHFIFSNSFNKRVFLSQLWTHFILAWFTFVTTFIGHDLLKHTDALTPDDNVLKWNKCCQYSVMLFSD